MGGTEVARRRERELVQRLSTIDEHEPQMVPSVLPALREYLDVDTVTAHTVALGRDGIECDAFHGSGIWARRVETFFRNTLRTEGTRYYTYDPLCPPRFQRNRVLRLADWPAPLRGVVRANHDATWGRFGIRDQMRVLVSDGTAPVMWISACSDELFDEASARAFRRIVPALRRRLLLERCMRDGDLARDALGLALDSIGAAAFVVDARGHVRFANSAGRAQLARDRGSHLAQLADALHASTPLYERFTTAGTGVSSHVLLVRRTPRNDAAVRHALAARAWNLTPRQAEVLALVARGHSNKSISALLRCAEHTVELHVSAILRRAEVTSRAALIAKLWTLA